MKELENYMSSLAAAGFSQSEINQFVLLRKAGIIVPRHICDIDLLRKIKSAIPKGLDVKYNHLQARELICGVQSGIDIKMYSNPEFSYYQMQEIRLALQHGVKEECISIFADPEISAYIMRNIRILLEKEFDTDLVSDTLKLMVDEASNYGFDVEAVRFALEDGVSLSEIKERIANSRPIYK